MTPLLLYLHMAASQNSNFKNSQLELWFGQNFVFFNLKNMISTCRKDFCNKESPNSPDFDFLARFVQQVPAGSLDIKGSFFKKVSYLVCSQIWLNYLVR